MMMTRAYILAAVAAALLCASPPTRAQESYAATPLNDLTFRIERLEAMARQSAFGDPNAAQRLSSLAAAVRDFQNNNRDSEFSQRLARVEGELAAMAARHDRDSTRLNAITAELGEARAGLVNLESRIAALENRVNTQMRSRLESPRTLTPTAPAAATGVTPLDAPVILDRAPAALPRLNAPMVDIQPLSPPPQQPPAPSASPLSQADFNQSESDASDSIAWQQYDQALTRLQQGDAAGAQVLFEGIDTGGDYAGRALYWIGEIRYRSKDYAGAADAYRRSHDEHPEGEESAASLLGLGVSLAHLERQDDACAVFRQVRATFSATSPSDAQRADENARTFNCAP